MLRLEATSPSCRPQNAPRLNFAEIARRALSRADTLLPRWLPGGRRRGHEYLALNPRRADRFIGSFSINVQTGRWADFATGDRGGDLISLYAFLNGLSQCEAARQLALEVNP
jgi:hypothetical protein